MNEFTVHTGGMGEELLLHVDWINERGVSQKTDVTLRILERDRPRILVVMVNGAEVARVGDR